MFKAVVLLWLALHACIAGHAQASCTYSLAGLVTGVDGAPLPGAGIIVTQGNSGVTTEGSSGVTTSNSGVTTDADGHYHIVNLCAGSYRIKVQFAGYQAI